MKPTSCAPFGLKFNPTHRFGSLNLTGEPHIQCQISTSIPSAVKVSTKTHVTRLTSKGAANIPQTGSSLHIATWTQQTTTWPCMLIQPFRAETSSYPDIFTGEHHVGNLSHGSRGRGGMAGTPVPSGNLGGFCWIRAANWRSSCFTISIINHKPIYNHVRSTIINHSINFLNHQSGSLKSQTTRVIQQNNSGVYAGVSGTLRGRVLVELRYWQSSRQRSSRQDFKT